MALRTRDLHLRARPHDGVTRCTTSSQLLAETLDLTDPKGLAELVRDEYGADQLELVHGGYADMLTWCTHLARQFWP